MNKNGFFLSAAALSILFLARIGTPQNRANPVWLIDKSPDGDSTVLWSRDGRFVRVDPRDRRRELQWDTTYFEVKTKHRTKLDSFQAQRIFGKTPFYLGFDPQNNRSEVSICSAATGKCLRLQNQPPELHRLVRDFERDFYQPTPDGREIWVTSGGEVRIWSTSTGALLRRVPLGNQDAKSRFIPRLSRDRKLVIARGENGNGIFDAHTGRLRFLIQPRPDNQADVGFSPSGSVFFVLVPDQDFRGFTQFFKSTSDGRTLWKFHSSSFASPAFSPKDNLVALAGNRSLELHDVSTGTLKRRIGTNNDAVNLALSPDGNTIWSSQVVDAKGFGSILSWRVR